MDHNHHHYQNAISAISIKQPLIISRTSFIQNHAFSPPKIHTAIVIVIVITIIIVPQLLGLIIPIFPLVKLRGEAREKSQIQVDHVTQIIFTASVLLYQITLNIIEQPAADPSSKNKIFLEYTY